MAQGERLYNRRDGVRLRPDRAEETPAHRQVQKEVARLYRRAGRMCRGRGPDGLPGEDPDAGDEGVFRAALAGSERQGGNGADGVEGLAAEAKGDHAGQVVGRLDLAGRVLR